MRSFQRWPPAWVASSAGIRSPSHPDSRYTVKGTPYMSVNRVTRNAENAPIARQSRPLRGWKKLAAKMMSRPVLRSTSGHSP